MTREMPDAATKMAREALDTIDRERAKVREARNLISEAEAGMNLACSKLYSYFAILAERERTK